MAYVPRLGTLQRFIFNRDTVLGNQADFATQTTRLNTGQRLLNNYDQIGGAKDLLAVTGKLSEVSSRADNTLRASTELELSEAALESIKQIMDQVKEDALQGASDTASSDDRKVLGAQLRNLGENLFQLSNTKIGKKYLFGGALSNKKVISHTPGGIFSNAQYKEGSADSTERKTENIQSSVSLSSFFTTSGQSASFTGSNPPNLPLTSNAEMNLLIHDGKNNINVGNISFSVGDDLNTIVSKINTAFNSAGGQGSIAQNDSGKLKFDTALISGNIKNSSATVVISKGTNLPNSLSNLGLKVSTTKGESTNIRETLSKLDEAYNSNDSEALRNLIIDIDANLNRLIASKSQLGDLVSKFNSLNEKFSELKIDYQIKQSDKAKIPVVEAIQEVNKAQAVLQASMRSSATLMSQSVFDYLKI